MVCEDTEIQMRSALWRLAKKSPLPLALAPGGRVPGIFRGPVTARGVEAALREALPGSRVC